MTVEITKVKISLNNLFFKGCQIKRINIEVKHEPLYKKKEKKGCQIIS